jgi:hypothetical protein
VTWKGRLVKLCALAASVLALTCASAAQASPGLRIGIADGVDAYPGFYTDLGKLHAQLLRVQLHWGGVSGVVRGRPGDATDPNDPAYNWSAYDSIVLKAAQQGTEVVFTIFGTPSWANGGGPVTRAPKSAVTLRSFAYAAATRYSGTFQRDDGTVLPRVRYWTAWNEPNLPLGLSPQWKKVDGKWIIQSARDYARICNAVVTGVKSTLISGEKVACGDTAPRGNNQPTGRRPTTSPIAFLRAMKNAGARGFDAFAHHPYPSGPAESPINKPQASTAVTFGNINVLAAEVKRLYGPLPIWIDEYAYQTNPPDRDLGVSPAKQARYLGEAVALARRNGRISMLLWFLVRDERRLSGWQSGLETASGKHKPAFAAFARAALDGA